MGTSTTAVVTLVAGKVASKHFAVIRFRAGRRQLSVRWSGRQRRATMKVATPGLPSLGIREHRG